MARCVIKPLDALDIIDVFPCPESNHGSSDAQSAAVVCCYLNLAIHTSPRSRTVSKLEHVSVDSISHTGDKMNSLVGVNQFYPMSLLKGPSKLC